MPWCEPQRGRLQVHLQGGNISVENAKRWENQRGQPACRQRGYVVRPSSSPPPCQQSENFSVEAAWQVGTSA